MRKSVIRKTAIGLLTSFLFVTFFLLASNNPNAIFKTQKDDFQHTWKIEQGNYKNYHASL